MRRFAFTRSLHAFYTRPLWALALAGAAGSAGVALGGCAPELDTTRQSPKRGSVGEEVYGVLCDRIAAASLREDMTGESFRGVCHRQNGEFSDVVDETRLPALDPGAKNEKGEPVALDKQKADRTRAIGRISALARRRNDLVAALDATFPEGKVGIKDLKNRDASKSCDAPAASGEGKFLDETADMLGRFTELYVDGTIPDSTRSLASVMGAFAASKEAQEAWARMEPRQGYRPASIALGAARPAVAYSGLRDLTNSLLAVLSADSKPYDPNPTFDGNKNRVPVVGSAYPQFTKTLEAAQLELLNIQPSTAVGNLTRTRDPQSGVLALSRPRTSLEIAQELLLAQDPAFGGGAPRYVVKRDARGYASVALVGGAIPAPFLDANADKLADVEADGRFKVASGVAPTPFFAIGGDATVKRDAFGRATPNAALVYDYIDTSKTFASQMLLDTVPLVNPDPKANRETLMDAFAGMAVIVGARDNANKTERNYAAGGSIAYNQIKAEDSPLLDMSYAALQILGDKSMDDNLALFKQLFEQNPKELARFLGGVLAARDLSSKYPNAKIAKTNTFWDEALDVTVKIAKKPGLLEDVLESLAADDSAQLGPAFGQYTKYTDGFTYDRTNLDGPPANVTAGGTKEPRTPVDRTKPDSGANRSIFQRFMQLMSDAKGVTSCNKDGAKVHAKFGFLNPDLPLIGTYKECEVFKIENLGAYFVDSVAGLPGKGNLNIRSSLMRNGVAFTVGQATTSLMEGSAGFTGFWSTGTELRPKPEWLTRLVFFDQKNDSPNSGDPNYRSNYFIRDLNGEFMGTSVCPERVIDDPCAGNKCDFGGNNPIPNDVAGDGKVRGLRNCGNGDWLQQRDKDTLFTLETIGGYRAMRPIAAAFSKNDASELFVEFAAAVHKHYQSDRGTPGECKGIWVNGQGAGQCSKGNLASYESLLSNILLGDVVPALTSLSKTIRATQIKRCTATNAAGACTATVSVSGTKVLAEATRAMIDPDAALALKLKDRRGVVTSKRNDGKTNPQTTPLYLLLNALNNVDDAHEKWNAAYPADTGRQDQWRRARSQLADQFLKTTGAGPAAQFANPALAKISPIAIDLLRSQLWAHCPKSFAPPYERCAWAKDELPKTITDGVTGPLFATTIDLMDGIRKDEPARRELEKLLTYMMSQDSANDAFSVLLASSVDIVQLLNDDKNLIPLLRVMSAAAGASKKDSGGRITEKSLVDANLALLGKISGKYIDANGTQICAREVDPNQVLPVILKNAVSPMTAKGLEGQTPVEVLIDIVADLNRLAPNEPKAKLEAADYANISTEVIDFLTNKERGLEQFYEIVRRGTAARKEQE